MKKILVDTNVIIDFLVNREPFFEDAVAIFSLAERKDIKIYISSLSVNNVYYVLRKLGNHHQKIINKLSKLFLLVTIFPVTDKTLKQAAKSTFEDFEDATQYFIARQLREINAIVTRDSKGFKEAAMSILTPAEYLKAIIAQKKH
jgi:predicted nucleic acid-binding protein